MFYGFEAMSSVWDKVNGIQVGPIGSASPSLVVYIRRKTKSYDLHSL